MFACNGIGHLTRDGKVACLAELQRVLRPGGVALLSLRTPYPDGVARWVATEIIAPSQR